VDNKRLKRLLIIKPSSLGDVIHAVPVASALKAAVPGLVIDWVVGKGYEQVLVGNKSVDRLIIFDRGMLNGGGRLGRLAGFVRELRREHYDAALDLQGLIRSALMALASRSERRIGFANAREGAALLYTDKTPVPDTGMHAVDRYLLTLRHFGVERGTADPVEFGINLTDEDEAQADSVLAGLGIKPGEKFAAIAPSARWATKRWPASNFVLLANMLYKDKGMRSMFVGTSEDEDIMSDAKEGLLQQGSFAFGKTSIKGLAALVRRAGILITNDSGPMHIAVAVGTPVAALFGPTDPVKTGPYGAAHGVIMATDSCAPCFKRHCDTVSCMEGLTVERVYDKVKDILGV